MDERFSHAVDGLIRVDPRETNPAILRRYMGAEGTARFLAFHEWLRRRA